MVLGASNLRIVPNKSRKVLFVPPFGRFKKQKEIKIRIKKIVRE